MAMNQLGLEAAERGHQPEPGASPALAGFAQSANRHVTEAIPCPSPAGFQLEARELHLVTRPIQDRRLIEGRALGAARDQIVHQHQHAATAGPGAHAARSSGTAASAASCRAPCTRLRIRR